MTYIILCSRLSHSIVSLSLSLSLLACFKSGSNTAANIYALHSKIALNLTSFALAKWIVRMVKCRDFLINRPYEIESVLRKYTHGKKLGNTSSPNSMFSELPLPVAWGYQIYDCIHFKALSIFCSN